jgi:hypothetical protein
VAIAAERIPRFEPVAVSRTCPREHEFPEVPFMSQFGSPYQPYGASPDPYARPKAGTSPWLIVGIVGGVMGLGVLVCCGGCGVWMYFSFEVMETEIANQLRDHPDFRQHVGEIKEFKYNWTASNAEPDWDVEVYDVVGTLGSGTVTVRTRMESDGYSTVLWAKIRLDSGQTVEIHLE